MEDNGLHQILRAGYAVASYVKSSPGNILTQNQHIGCLKTCRFTYCCAMVWISWKGSIWKHYLLDGNSQNSLDSMDTSLIGRRVWSVVVWKGNVAMLGPSLLGKTIGSTYSYSMQIQFPLSWPACFLRSWEEGGTAFMNGQICFVKWIQ